MEFPTPNFAWFFLAVLTVAWALRRNRVARNVFLLLASYAFCWKWQPMFLAAIVGSSLFNYFVGERLHDETDAVRKKRLVSFGVLANLGFLGWFKYYGFFTDSLTDLATAFGLELHLPVLRILAPLGISFYTFQGIAYLVDTYWGRSVRPKTVLDFLLFVAFFPQLAAGPICRSEQLLPQIMEDPPEEVPDVSRAVALITAGLMKKMVLGTYLATHMVEDAFISPDDWSSLELWVVVFAYTASIYLDFSGYTDIARGCGRLLGFEIPENFRYPYAADNIGEYWRRWHITFSGWLRDYIYFPLGGSRVGRMRTYINLMITFIACGIWHGASWGYVIWGGLHGIGLSVYKASLDVRRDMGIDLKGPAPAWRHWGGWAVTLSFCALARIYFKCPDIATAHQFWVGLFAGTVRGNGLEVGVVVVTVLTILLNFHGRPVFEAFAQWHTRVPRAVRPLAWAGIALLLLTVRPYDVAPTTYFQF